MPAEVVRRVLETTPPAASSATIPPPAITNPSSDDQITDDDGSTTDVGAIASGVVGGVAGLVAITPVFFFSSGQRNRRVSSAWILS